MTEIDGWHTWDIISPLFFNDNTDLHNLIRKRLILPYLTGPSTHLLLKNTQVDFWCLWLCARSWLARHPATMEITRSSGGSSHNHSSFFFFKNHDFPRFLINFSTVVVVKHTHVVDPKRLTHIHSHRDLKSLSLSTENTYLLVPIPWICLRTTPTGASKASVSVDGSHSSKVRPESSSSTRWRHTFSRWSHEGAFTVPKAYHLVLLVLAGTQLELLLYATVASSNLTKLQ